tara:strand:+ start:485 stop:913 length:429 start_codon:yes stop_codon:yes gene_type:complete
MTRKIKTTTVPEFRDILQVAGIDPDSDKGTKALRLGVEQGVIYVPAYASAPLSNYSTWQHDVLNSIRSTEVLACFNVHREIKLQSAINSVGLTLNSFGEPVELSWRFSLDNAKKWLRHAGYSDNEFRKSYFDLVGFDPAQDA